jgi:hypothetical protein
VCSGISARAGVCVLVLAVGSGSRYLSRTGSYLVAGTVLVAGAYLGQVPI